MGGMRISFVGMSNAGKTYWSKQLEKTGFKRYGCDDFIEAKLLPQLVKHGYKGTDGISRWMGQPYESHYIEASKTYLKLEKEAMQHIFTLVKADLRNDTDRIVIDTTGSLIYLNRPILQTLNALTRVVCLDTPTSALTEMYTNYISDPKPVIWGNAFSKKAEETNLEALKRCYPELLNFRIQKYKKIVDISLDYYLLRNNRYTTDHLLRDIE